MSYLALEKGLPIFKHIYSHFTLKATTLILIQESIVTHLIYIPEANKIFQFASFKYMIYPRFF